MNSEDMVSLKINNQKIAKIKEWLNEECQPEIVKQLSNGAQYIPIGRIEVLLDHFDSWGTSDFKFTMYKIGNVTYASGSVLLYVKHADTQITRNGAMSFPITNMEGNTDYEGTILSFCIANAAKKLGKKFGRHLNGRLEQGETGILPVVQIQQTNHNEVDKEFSDLKEKLLRIENKEEAQTLLSTSTFRLNMDLKNIVNSKK